MSLPKPSLVNLSVEEESLASIPFAVLERRVGKKVDKLEVQGVKYQPDGTQTRVIWQVQGNNQLGLPTEQDLDIFVALGMLTFQNNFRKTVTFTGPELARILNIKGVHGKFYQRVKIAMDRFIPLRFRSLTITDRQEEVKWLNVFQEASFSLDRETGRCIGSVTWTDKLIQSMNSGFFRLLDSGRYMQLDGITAKHLYRYLAVAFEKTDVVILDARTLAQEHLGILNLPKYFSRLMQTLEPAFEQLIQVQVLGSYHVVSVENWRIALHRHAQYVPERKTLLLEAEAGSLDLQRAHARKFLEQAGLPASSIEGYIAGAHSLLEILALQRAGHLIAQLKEQGVMPHVALSLVRKAMEADVARPEGRDILDWCEIALEICREKRTLNQTLKNPAGLLVSIIKDPEKRQRLVTPDAENAFKQRFRQRELSAVREHQDAEEQAGIIEYERFRQELAERLFQDMPEERRRILRKEKLELIKQQERFDRIPSEMRESQAEEMVLQDLARNEAPPFEKWYLRRRAHQVTLPFTETDAATA